MQLRKVLEVKNIHYRDILNGVNFDWHQGEIIALMGTNGSGKSTLARLLVGLAEPDEGEIHLEVDGVPAEWNKGKRWQEIGLVGQHPKRQTIGVTVAEELAFGLLSLGHNSDDVRSKVKELASSVGLGGKENQSPATLSGGERQRLVTAAILAIKPSFLILDEGLTMLDARAQANVLKLLFQARPETGQLWITHDAELAWQADRLLVLERGKLVDKGSPRGAFTFSEFCTLYGFSGLLDETTSDKGSTVEKRFAVDKRFSVIQNQTDLGITETVRRVLERQTQPALEWRQAHYATRLELNNTVKAGEFIGIVGPSGSGKTTLLESAIGLILPTEGQVFGFAERITKDSLSAWRRKTRLVLQEAGEYLIGRTVYHEIYYGETRRELETKRQSRVSYLEKFNLPASLLEAAPERLSGGERQRVALAAALRTSPEILLMDEPLLGLDAWSRIGIQTMISELKDVTILYVTHDLREVIQDADRLWLVEDGKVVLDCSKQSWKDHQEQFRAAGVRC
ncbi:ABC transporter ATP-binding protein [Desulfosporosinus metallidurans]|uniref:ATPase component BioM of energizing module of biotin ECF transporter n=1 Tax=Desulfosporosinus metallidurans TaxID=1888891 RepID=A0A1Q8QYJ5_9FIRM|nr:ATP-binding cassette domain-containing protein [Desulfosporosinus metallidurans]OLN32386.1 ATPase component BioM of energizing module of biotin ECF transporter [Desulfosporosinus metallidurans]